LPIELINEIYSDSYSLSLYAGLCVTNLFIFFDDVFEGVDPENLNKLDTLCDKDMKAILEKGKHILKCAKVFSEWAPEVRKRVRSMANSSTDAMSH
jgi:hypothetical protein